MASEWTDTYKTSIRIVFLCVLWYASSSANSVVGKVILSDFPYPMTVSMVQLLSITLYTMPILIIWGIPTADRIPMKYWFKMILPLALGKFFSSVSSHISLWKVPVSYAHTVKATMPLFTVLLSRILLKETHHPKIYLSLLPIVGGVAVATVTELSFDMIGLISALASTLGFALQNIFSKKCLKETGIHHFRLLYILALISTVFFMPIWFLYDGRTILQDSALLHSSHLPRLIGLLVIDGFCNFAQNLVAFTVIAMVTPLSYAVANATKRISVIAISLLLLRNPVTLPNICGMLTAIFGVLLYNKTKYDLSKQQLLPTIVKTPASATANGSIMSQEDDNPPTDPIHFSANGTMYLDPKAINGYSQKGSIRTVDSSGNIFGANLMDGKGGVMSMTRWV